MASHQTLTFGVELEFIITTRKEHENNQETYEAMTELFLKNLANPLPCACVHGKWSKYRGTAYRYPDGIPLDKKDWKNYYCFSGDGSVVIGTKEKAQNDTEKKIAVGLELSTRALKFDKQGCPEFDATFAAIRDGGSLTNTKISDRFEPLPTQSAGLHVHVGIESGLDLETAKKAAILGWLLEPCLFSLCNHDRGMTLTNAPIRKYSLLAQTKFNITESDTLEDTLEDDAPKGEGKVNNENIEISQEKDEPKDGSKDEVKDKPKEESKDELKDELSNEHSSENQDTHEEKRASDDGEIPSGEDKTISGSIREEFASTCEKVETTEPIDTGDPPEDEVEPSPTSSAQEDETSDGLPREFSAKEKTWISAIFGTSDMGELAELLSGTNVNFMNRRLALAVYNRENDHSTIEFRHFQSTMDENLAWAWVRIAAALVQTASKPVSEYKEKLQLIAHEYRSMKSKWKQHLRDRTFRRETTDPWLDSWKWMLEVLDLGDDIPFWQNYVAQLPERNRTT
ncbi:hypothetical protein F4781DRAFT_80600 [Annulohypoxylon bovei var. microspora]|nr:hypothetical protein F4781DRAFT_80600 [Annulohypoxylon bovei var. microspora]